MARKKKGAVPFRQETKITYNKYKPNRKARRLGIKPEEPQEREEKTTASKLEVLMGSAQRVGKIQRQIIPPDMTYGKYMEYLKGRRQQLEEKKQGVHNGRV